MMEKNLKITVVTCLLAVVLVLVLTYLRVTGNNQTAGATAVTLTAEELRELGAVVYEEPVVLQPFSLTDQRGQVFSQNNVIGGWSLVFFGFTSCPDICPLTLAELSQFYNNLPLDILAKTNVIMVSVDPDRDTTAKMAEYMGSFHEDFIGLNGPYADVAALAKPLFIAHSPPPAQAYSQNAHAGHSVEASAEQDYVIDHSGNVLIINPAGRYHGFFDAAIQDRELTQAFEAITAAY
jgi:protein SCO1/2